MGDNGGAPTGGEAETTKAPGAEEAEVETEQAETTAEVGSGENETAGEAAEVVSVSYCMEVSDLRAAGWLATYVVPNIVRVRRAARFGAALLGVTLVILLSVAPSAGSDVSALAFGGTVAATGVLLLYSSRHFWAYHAARNPLSRESLGEISFRADHDGIATTAGDSGGSHGWSRIQRVAEGDEGVVFSTGRILFMYVPARALSEADRATLRRIAADGPEWLDLRAGRSLPG